MRIANENETMRDQRRLLGAADSLLRAIASPEGFETSVEAVVDVGGEPGRLPSGVFTVGEYVEAMRFLVRFGLVTDGDRTHTALTGAGPRCADASAPDGRGRLLDSGTATLASLLLNAPGPRRRGSGGLFSDGGIGTDERA